MDKKENFEKSVHCRSRLYCKWCRRDENYRKDISKYLEFDENKCPLKLPIDASLEEIETAVKNDNSPDRVLPKKNKPKIINPKIQCLHKGKNVGDREVECCGGRKKLLPHFLCLYDMTEKKFGTCNHCNLWEAPPTVHIKEDF